MNYRITENGGVTRIALEGSLNFAANEEFQRLLQTLLAARPGQVVFDLSGLGGIDSVGLGLLYIAQEDLSAQGGRLVLASPRANVARLLDLTEAQQTFTIVP